LKGKVTRGELRKKAGKGSRVKKKKRKGSKKTGPYSPASKEGAGRESPKAGWSLGIMYEA